MLILILLNVITDYESEKSTTSTPQITGGLVFSTTSAPFDCKVNDDVFRDGESITMNSEKPCEHCYCMRGDIVCAVQDCGEPLRGKDCTPETPPAGQCCPTSYQCGMWYINIILTHNCCLLKNNHNSVLTCFSLFLFQQTKRPIRMT